MVYNLWSPSRTKSRDAQVKASPHEPAMSSGSPASVTASNAEAERSQLPPESHSQLPPQLQKVSEEKSSEASQSIEDTPNAVAQGEAGGELNSKDGSLAVSGEPVTSGKQQKEEEGNPNANDIQKDEKDKENSRLSKEDEGYAPNVFYAYARRTDADKPNNHLYLLTFTSASDLPLFLSTVRSAFPDSQISRDAPQLLTFKGDDVLEKAWKADKQKDLKELKRKWFYTPLADTTTKPQPILPLQDEKGWLIGSQIAAAASGIGESMRLPPRPSLSSRTSSTKGKEKKSVGFADQLLPSSSADASAAAAAAIATLPNLTKHLDRISSMLETSASQIKSLESAQETTYATLASALETSVHQIQQLTLGQQKLVESCEELRKAVREKEEMWQGDGVGGLGWPSSASTASCGHEVHKPPRKVGRKVVGYVYEEMERNGVEEKEK